MAGVAAAQRYDRRRRCPICGGAATDQRRQQRRCIGFLSSDGRYAHCSREEHAGALPMKESSGTYPHWLGGSCRCGVEHGVVVTPMARTITRVAPGRPLLTVPASSLSPVERWLREVRCLAPAEIAVMWAVDTNGGAAVAFRYLRSDGSLHAVKVRLIDGKTMFRSPAGAGALPLYGWRGLARAADAAVIVEGELDLHALRSVGITGVASVPDGARTRVTPGLLAPLAAVPRVVLAVDQDEEGEGLAARLAAALGPERCQRVVFGSFKDANEALCGGWGRREFLEALGDRRSEAA